LPLDNSIAIWYTKQEGLRTEVQGSTRPMQKYAKEGQSINHHYK